MAALETHPHLWFKPINTLAHIFRDKPSQKEPFSVRAGEVPRGGRSERTKGVGRPRGRRENPRVWLWAARRARHRRREMERTWRTARSGPEGSNRTQTLALMSNYFDSLEQKKYIYLFIYFWEFARPQSPPGKAKTRSSGGKTGQLFNQTNLRSKSEFEAKRSSWRPSAPTTRRTQKRNSEGAEKQQKWTVTSTLSQKSSINKKKNNKKKRNKNTKFCCDVPRWFLQKADVSTESIKDVYGDVDDDREDDDAHG